jgi:uncharacterized membrane protein
MTVDFCGFGLFACRVAFTAAASATRAFRLATNSASRGAICRAKRYRCSERAKVRCDAAQNTAAAQNKTIRRTAAAARKTSGRSSSIFSDKQSNEKSHGDVDENATDIKIDKHHGKRASELKRLHEALGVALEQKLGQRARRNTHRKQSDPNQKLQSNIDGNRPRDSASRNSAAQHGELVTGEPSKPNAKERTSDISQYNIVERRANRVQGDAARAQSRARGQSVVGGRRRADRCETASMCIRCDSLAHRPHRAASCAAQRPQPLERTSARVRQRQRRVETASNPQSEPRTKRRASKCDRGHLPVA